MERALAQIPEFYTLGNLRLLGEAAAMTLSMTFVGCFIGFFFALVLVYLRQTPGIWALPLRVICITYVEIFRRIPFIVVIYLVLFFIQTITTDASLFSIVSSRSAYTRSPTQPTSFAAASNPCRKLKSRQRAR